MAESLNAMKRAESLVESNLLIMSRNELMDELKSVINNFVRLRESESSLMLELGFF
ncbi:hypothetical protein CRYUN_Cryun38cG0033200 [Craigia yunnanensis]